MKSKVLEVHMRTGSYFYISRYNESTEQKFDLFCTFLVVCDIIHRVTGKYYPYHHPCGVKKQSCIVLFGVDLSRGCGQKVLV